MKVALALIWLFSSFAANSLSLVVTHERLPEVAPLPDVLHQTLPQHRAHLTVDQYAKNHLNPRLCGRLLAIIGICSMLVGRGHYSIDVFIAYLLTVHVWWIYHALAYNHKSPQHTPWWFALFVFFESNAPFDLPPLPSDASSSDLEPAFDDKVIVIPKITKKEDIAIPKITKKDDKGLF